MPGSSSPRLVEVAAFFVIGLTARTTNQREMSGEEGRIGPLWQEFMQGGDRRIPGARDQSPIFSVYTGYESDEKGAYDVILGRSVSEAQSVPAAMRGIHIPAARYLVFPSAGSTPEAIQGAWAAVYAYFSGRASPRRAFTADFEEHSTKGVYLYIAVR
jgi:predicted transcriptional regulator YdeE